MTTDLSPQTGVISRWKNLMQRQEGWRRYMMACLLGAGLTLCFAPFDLLPLSFIVFPSLIWILQALDDEQRTQGDQAFLTGWWFGLGHHVTGLYWITVSLTLDGWRYVWVIPFALLLLPAYLSLFIGGVCWIFHKATRWKGKGRLIAFAVLWTIAEYLRSVIMGGFPWNLMGYVWTTGEAMLQPASLVGVYGMSLWIVLLSVSFSCLGNQASATEKTRPQLKLLFLMFAVSVGLIGWGQMRLNHHPMLSDAELVAAKQPLVRLVQADIDQSMKWDSEMQKLVLKKHLKLSRQGWYESTEGDDGNIQARPDIIVWPETAMPYSFGPGSSLERLLGGLVPEDGVLMTGTTRMEDVGTPDWKIWNSIQVIEGGEYPAMLDPYDKVKLVPFGEFLPMRWFFDFFKLDKVTHGSMDFTQGEGARYLRIPGNAPLVQPLICYETIFSYFRPQDTQQRPDWLFNATNDAWFGNSTGPFQHLQMARTRAVEQGTPMVRAANTGVSAVFDAYGRTKARLELNEEGIINARLPIETPEPTLYQKHGEFPVFLLCYLLLILAFILRD